MRPVAVGRDGAAFALPEQPCEVMKTRVLRTKEGEICWPLHGRAWVIKGGGIRGDH